MTTTLTPHFLWAQDKDKLHVSIDLSEAKDIKVDMTNTKFDFSCTNKGKKYAVAFEFLHEIVVDDSKYDQHRLIEFLLQKKDTDSDYWGSLMKNKKQFKTHCKVDFDKWIDSDDEGDIGAGFGGGAGGPPGGPGGAGGMDMAKMMSMMGGQGGMGGMGGGAGGMGGMDMAKMMGGMGGAGGMGGMDMAKMMGSMGGPGAGAGAAEVDSDDDDLPDLEDDVPAETADKKE